MMLSRWLKSSGVISVASIIGVVQVCPAQETSDKSDWSASSEHRDPHGHINPFRTHETHTESGGRVISTRSIEALGPDGQYLPYLDTEKESVQVDSTKTRTTERAFNRDANGKKALVQISQEESRNLSDGEQKVVRTISNPDANGTLQVVRRELQDSMQAGPGVRETKTTVLIPNTNGGLTAAVQIEERQKQLSDGSVEFKKSTLLSDGEGNWHLGEVSEGISKQQDGQNRTGEERVLRPDSNGTLAVVERKVSKQTGASPGEEQNIVETYSVNVPGTAGDGNLQLVQRETVVRQTTTGGERTTTQQIERPTPGAPSDGLHVTDAEIDIVRPGGNRIAAETRTVLTLDSDGRSNEVWIDIGKTVNPSATKVDARTSAKR